MTTERREYTETLPALDGDCDFRRRLKPSAMMRYVEQVSADHARANQMDYQFFREHHSAFLVAKQAVRITRMPRRWACSHSRRKSCSVPSMGSMFP